MYHQWQTERTADDHCSASLLSLHKNVADPSRVLAKHSLWLMLMLKLTSLKILDFFHKLLALSVWV